MPLVTGTPSFKDHVRPVERGRLPIVRALLFCANIPWSRYPSPPTLEHLWTVTSLLPTSQDRPPAAPGNGQGVCVPEAEASQAGRASRSTEDDLSLGPSAQIMDTLQARSPTPPHPCQRGECCWSLGVSGAHLVDGRCPHMVSCRPCKPPEPAPQSDMTRARGESFQGARGSDH